MKLKIIITGDKVHGVGYRVMLVNKALSLGINNFNVFNTFLQGNQAVFAIIEGDEDVLGEFKDYVNNVKPEEAGVDNISFEDYRNAIPPIERVMQAFQMEQWGKGIPILLKMLEKQDGMLEKQDKMLEKQDSVIERQDITIGILKGVKEDTTHIPAMKEDTSEIKSNTREIVDKLQNKYEEMSREITQMKITLARIEAKVFS
ncbi:MAG: acylphosphatase [Candidatus Methanoperedens sp.]|nr:acylphosphatase [Candidatus Methanoperedens sp.]